MLLFLSTIALPSISRVKFLSKPSLFTFTSLRRIQLPHKHSTRTVSCVANELHNRTPKREGDLVVLGIETSCDDTAVAVVRSDGEILSQVVSSQADLLVKYGGVDPKMAEEAHSQVIDQVVQEALDKAYMTEKDLTAVAVTIGPGLSLCLRVGVQKARRIAGGFNLPIIGIHHMEAHALVARLIEKDLQFPFMALLISGGHNLLILARDLGQYIQLGTTIDDAIGEAYDKLAKWLGLDMSRSGGPAIEELAREGNDKSFNFSIPMKQHKDCNFSYAGLKTQVRRAIESKKIDAKIPISSASYEDRMSRADMAASFQRIAVLHLEERCERAIQWALKMEPSIKHLVISGGVASNQYVRARLDAVVKKNGLQLVCPPPRLSVRTCLILVLFIFFQAPLRPLVLGGDHSISFPVIRAVSEKLGGPVDVLHIDAHPDNYDAFEGNIYSHASSFARVMEGDYVRRLLQVGIRSITAEGRAQAKVKYHKETSIDSTISYLGFKIKDKKLGEGVKGVYISIDVDCLDPAFAPGVSHIEPGGLSFRDVLNILHNLQGDVVAGDVVELNPQRDTVDGMTAMVAAKLVREMAAKIAK